MTFYRFKKSPRATQTKLYQSLTVAKTEILVERDAADVIENVVPKLFVFS